MPAFWLSDYDIQFPLAEYAEWDGLVAVGGDLRPERLVNAYRNGIFPWYERQGQFFWYSPNPRCVLFPQDLKVHKSMRSIFNQHKFEYTLNTQFRQVIEHCSHIWRPFQVGNSWITDSFIENYTKLHEKGIAHSLEVWENGELVGGLYGLSLGKIFSGESMFSLRPNASKAGFITLVCALEKAGFTMIDCQQETEHLKSLGAKNIERADFLNITRGNWHEENLGFELVK